MPSSPPSRRLATALCCLVALSAVAGVGAADSHVAIEKGPGSETLGDVAELTVSVPENGSATVTLEVAGIDQYSRTVRLTDASGDGTVTLQVNTFRGRAGARDSAVYSVSDSDEMAIEQSNGSRLTAGDYGLAVYNGTDTDGEPAATTTLWLNEPRKGSVAYSVARPSVTESLDSRDGIEAARRNGSLVDVEGEVAAGDTVVLTLRVDGLEGGLAAAPGADDTARFTAMVERTNTSLRLQWGDTPQTYPKKRYLNRDTITAVVADDRNDRYHVVLNTTSAGITPASNDGVDEGAELTPYFVVAGEQRLNERYDHVDGFDIDEPHGEFLSDVWGARGGNTTTVRGETNLAPGSEVVVRLAANGTTVSSASVTVGTDRRFDVPLDVADARQADSTTLTLLHDGTEIETVANQLVLSVPEDQSIADGELHVPSVWLSDDGYVHVVGPDGTVVGRSDELVERSDHDITIGLSLTEIGPDESLVVVPSEAETIDPGEVSYGFEAFLVDVPPAGIAVNVTVPGASEQSTPNETASTATADGGGMVRLPSTNTPMGSAAETTTTAADGAGFGVLATLVASLLALSAGGVRWH